MAQSVRRILVCLDGSPEGLDLGRDAAGLARRLDAELVALWGPRRPSPSPAETFARGAGPIREVLEHQAAGEEALVSAARAAFAELTASLDLRTDFRAAWDSASDPLPRPSPATCWAGPSRACPGNLTSWRPGDSC